MSRIQGWNSFCSKYSGSYYEYGKANGLKPLSSSQPERCEDKEEVEFVRCPVCQTLCARMTSIKGYQEGHLLFQRLEFDFLYYRGNQCNGSVDDWVEKLEPHCLVTYLADNRFKTRTLLVYFPVQCESETQRNWDFFYFVTISQRKHFHSMKKNNFFFP